VVMSNERPDERLTLAESLTRLGRMDPRQARIVELRIFAGLSVEIELIVWATSRRRIQDAVNLQSQFVL
jgi:hypothetical protein